MVRVRWRVAVVFGVVAATLALSAPAADAEGATGGGDRSEALAQELDWQPCYAEVSAETGASYECAELLVPLDYDDVGRRRHPNRWEHGRRGGGRSYDRISIALVRIPADPALREGAILLNPGGPGGSGISFLLDFGPAAGFVFGPEVPARFDLVGFDPRGIGSSTPIRCFDTVEEAVEVFPPIAFPLARSEVALFRDADQALARACRRYDGAREIGEHMSTANVARDMDVIRASMGDESLNFLGLSYGTYVAATYANLFPDRVRAVVADGVLDPVAWVNRGGAVPFSTTIRSDEGAAETLEEFFVQCEAAAPGNCAFAPDSRARYAALADRLRTEGPILLPEPETGGTFPFTYQDLIGFSLGNLYSAFGYADMALGLAFFEAVAGAAPTPVDATPPAVVRAWMADEPYDNFVETLPAVACVDTDNPRSYNRWYRAGVRAEETYGYFGRLWTWVSSPCARWPFRDRDRYVGPFTATTASPVLVIGNLYDPATRYEGAQALRSLLPNSALLTVDVPGHTSLGLSACAGFLTGQYFLAPAATAAAIDGFTCPQEFNAFDVVAGPPVPPEADPPEEGPAIAAATTADTVEMEAMIELRAVVDEQLRVALGRAGR